MLATYIKIWCIIASEILPCLLRFLCIIFPTVSLWNIQDKSHHSVEDLRQHLSIHSPPSTHFTTPPSVIRYSVSDDQSKKIPPTTMTQIAILATLSVPAFGLLLRRAEATRPLTKLTRANDAPKIHDPSAYEHRCQNGSREHWFYLKR